jgi:hypothetical protein
MDRSRAYLCGVLFPLLGDDVLPQEVIVGDRVPRAADLHQAVEIRPRRWSCVRELGGRELVAHR